MMGSMILLYTVDKFYEHATISQKTSSGSNDNDNVCVKEQISNTTQAAQSIEQAAVENPLMATPKSVVKVVEALERAQALPSMEQVVTRLKKAGFKNSLEDSAVAGGVILGGGAALAGMTYGAGLATDALISAGNVVGLLPGALAVVGATAVVGWVGVPAVIAGVSIIGGLHDSVRSKWNDRESLFERQALYNQIQAAARSVHKMTPTESKKQIQTQNEQLKEQPFSAPVVGALIEVISNRYKKVEDMNVQPKLQMLQEVLEQHAKDQGVDLEKFRKNKLNTDQQDALKDQGQNQISQRYQGPKS